MAFYLLTKHYRKQNLEKNYEINEKEEEKNITKR